MPVFGPEEEPPQLTWSQAIWARMNLNGLWFWLDYFLYPFMDWIFYPFFRFTIWPLLSWIAVSLSYIFSFLSGAEVVPVDVHIDDVVETAMMGMNEVLGENARTVVDTVLETTTQEL